MIEDTDRNALVKYRLNQAIETNELAIFLVNNDKLVIAVNRIYYAMYYALTALALKNSFETSKHGN
jgi:uncharacterized protein (UPF0332 family)